MDEILQTPVDVIDALGGTNEASRVTNSLPQAVSNWKARKRIPPEHFLTISKALETIGKTVSPDVFGMRTGPTVAGASDAV